MNSGMTLGIIAFVTDFGLKYNYVSEMHTKVTSMQVLVIKKTV